MNYKEKVIALLKSQELSDEQKRKIEEIFPELKESEDEKIRKWIIKQIKTYDPSIIKDKALAWLEKQGKQKPTDKVEPKFRNGQWIVWRDKCYKVNYNGCGYELVDQNGLSTSLEYGTIDENAHLWDITRDAKDGDVLFMDNGSANCIFIYKSSNNGIINKYASYNKFGFEGEHYLVMNDGYVIPATKEQRNTLEKAMADAGYTFDFVKKELKKIEQNPAWSEEDEKFINNVKESLLAYKIIVMDNDMELANYIEKEINWLKSLSYKTGFQKHWKPRKEQIIALRWVLSIVPYNMHKEEISGLLNQIKDL